MFRLLTLDFPKCSTTLKTRYRVKKKVVNFPFLLFLKDANQQNRLSVINREHLLALCSFVKQKMEDEIFSGECFYNFFLRLSL